MMQFDVLITNTNIATMSDAFGYAKKTPYGTIHDGALGIKDGKIAFVGTEDELGVADAHKIIDAKQSWLTPALIDCHTHLVYGGNRSNEFEMRLNGMDYQEIVKQGGGILSTVQATRQSSIDELYKLSLPRFKSLIKEGVGTIEIKSGYGLNLDGERKMLQVAKKLGDDFGISVKKTYLALHALPSEYVAKADEYVNQACNWLKVLHDENLVDAVDAFCESIAFDKNQVSKLFDVAKSLGLPVKLHAEQMSDMGGAGLVAEFNGLSADHIEYLSTDSIIKMAKHDTVGVLLPTAFYTLKETKLPPIDTMRQYGIKMAVSTDCNPGTSPSTSLLLAMNMACTLFGLTPEEALAGTTIHASKALGLQNSKGQIALGMDADVALWDIDRPADLSYLIGQNHLQGLWVAGKAVMYFAQ